MKKISLLSAVAIIIFFGAGCITIGAPQNQGADGGIFKSLDRGQTWAQKNILLTAKGVGTLNSINIMDLVMDPQDDKAVYATTAGNGLFYTWDGMESWHFVDALGGGYVNSVAIDYKDKCILYAALQNKVQKSIDCARSWDTMYFDTRQDIYVSALVVDPANSAILFAGFSQGDLLRSLDGGKSWSTIKRLDNKITRLFISRKDSKIMYLTTENSGLWKSTDAGANWTDLKPKTSEFRDSNVIYDFDMDKDEKMIYLTSMYGIITSDDGGNSWKKIDLLTPPGTVQIYSLAINPNNAQEIYYSTANTFYSSFDGGKNWVTKKLPTGRTGAALMVHPKDGGTLYMGTRLFKK
jgi:photosystem II stability/assembly factor-like uncharacterized protein